MAEIRNKARTRFLEIIESGIDKGKVPKLSKNKIDDYVEDLEIGIFNYAIRRCKECGKSRKWEEPAFKQYYKEQFSFISINLNVDKNPTLLRRLVEGEFTSDDLCAKKRFDKKTQSTYYGMNSQDIIDIEKEDEEEDEEEDKIEGLFTCKFCKSKRTTYTQRQTRSGDENLTNFITCRDCGKTFRS